METRALQLQANTEERAELLGKYDDLTEALQAAKASKEANEKELVELKRRLARATAECERLHKQVSCFSDVQLPLQLPLLSCTVCVRLLQNMLVT